ncbi:MAG: hypothetical protein EBU81_01270 [Proteobacteria bacterium]|nr:hypothetical protein [Pseudomonadota bacterium]
MSPEPAGSLVPIAVRLIDSSEWILEAKRISENSRMSFRAKARGCSVLGARRSSRRWELKVKLYLEFEPPLASEPEGSLTPLRSADRSRSPMVRVSIALKVASSRVPKLGYWVKVANAWVFSWAKRSCSALANSMFFVLG